MLCLANGEAWQREQQTSLRDVPPRRRSVLDSQRPLPRRPLPPAVSRHERPVLESLRGVVMGPEPQLHRQNNAADANARRKKKKKNTFSTTAALSQFDSWPLG